MTRDHRDAYSNSIRRDAWHGDLLHAELAERSAERRRAVAMRCAIAAGVVIGLVGSYFTHFA
jgi:hypothetical protein